MSVLLKDYLNNLQENEEQICRKKHSSLKKKDFLAYRYYMIICQMNLIEKKLKPYNSQMNELERNYCKEEEIKKRKNVKVLWDPLSIRKCWKERDKKIEQIQSKTKRLRKRWWELRKEFVEIQKKIHERNTKRGMK